MRDQRVALMLALVVLGGFTFQGLEQNERLDDGSLGNFGEPPDPNLAVGPSDVVQVVNASMRIWLKPPPAPFRQVATRRWPGFEAGCRSASA